MDLGFGNANQVVGDAASRLMLQQAKAQEQQLDSEMHAYDALLEDDDAMEALRARRLEQMKQQQQKRLHWKSLGHGEYSELAGSDIPKAFFEATKASDKLVVHFYRPTTDLCDIFHAHLAQLAPKHMETRFLKINVEGCDQGQGGAASYLVEKLGIIIMPTIVIVKDRKVIHHIRGFDELGGTKEFSTKALEYMLGVHGGLNHPDDAEIPEELLPENEQRGAGANSIRIRGGSRLGATESSIRDGTSISGFGEDF